MDLLTCLRRDPNPKCLFDTHYSEIFLWGTSISDVGNICGTIKCELCRPSCNDVHIYLPERQRVGRGARPVGGRSWETGRADRLARQKGSAPGNLATRRHRRRWFRWLRNRAAEPRGWCPQGWRTDTTGVTALRRSGGRRNERRVSACSVNWWPPGTAVLFNFHK